jgi:WD repeat-containing protein 19
MRIVASSGVARCSLKLGNIRQGIKIAMEVGVNSLFSECGDILEDQKQYQEAADMHIKANEYERAAFIYTKHIIRLDKNKISEAAKILERVKNDQLNIAFAKACFAAGRYQEAMEAYKRAKDNDKVA